MFKFILFLKTCIDSADGWRLKNFGRIKLPSWIGGVAAASADGVVDRQLRFFNAD